MERKSVLDYNGLSHNDVQRIIEYVAQARDGLITKKEMADKIEKYLLNEGGMGEPFCIVE